MLFYWPSFHFHAPDWQNGCYHTKPQHSHFHTSFRVLVAGGWWIVAWYHRSRGGRVNDSSISNNSPSWRHMSSICQMRKLTMACDVLIHIFICSSKLHCTRKIKWIRYLSAQIETVYQCLPILLDCLLILDQQLHDYHYCHDYPNFHDCHINPIVKPGRWLLSTLNSNSIPGQRSVSCLSINLLFKVVLQSSW